MEKIVGVIAVEVLLVLLVIGAAIWLSNQGGSGSAPSLLARAIGVAEGGYDINGNNLNNGTLPSVNHNPGDLTADVSGNGTGTNGGFVVYSSDVDGYGALEAQIGKWLGGTSANATADSTISNVSQFYTTPGDSGNDQTNWANNVASAAGVSTDTSIGDIGD